MHETWTGWYKNGKKSYEVKYNQGVNDGPALYWYENGNAKLEKHYQDTVLNGDFKAWQENGKQTVSGTYVNGKKDGKWLYFDLLNPELIIREEYYENGKPQGKWITRYKYGRMESIKNFKDGKKHGLIKYMKPDGEVIYEAIFKNDKLEKLKVDKKRK
jgi:antitoxin component YwqK of YwqJK toxin-antitoxin module